ncbi:hypothetical protein HHI36_017319 [Cryptolaemus montrouzieri]|uniref:Uncharacterized protein n=1 Tax=Cryptolaemus montrouzieri TaxID=559131 RepID=A0ABD2NM46_9CUCU
MNYIKTCQRSRQCYSQKQYTNYRNTLHKLIAQAKRNISNRSKSNALWKYVNNICNQSRPETKIESMIRADGELKCEIAEEFVEYYSELGEKYSKKIKDPESFEEREDFVNKTIFLYPTDPEEVKKITSELKDRRAAGQDGIKRVSNEIAHPIS